MDQPDADQTRPSADPAALSPADLHFSPSTPDTDCAEGAPTAVRSRLALALDVDDAVVAIRLAADLAPWFGVAKVGLQLYGAAGPAIVQELIDQGMAVFVDLKLADIPTTVRKATRVLGALGASYVTLHAFTGLAMLRAGVEGLAAGAEAAGLDAPNSLAVTVLTSDDTAPAHILPARVGLAVEAGCSGVVCAADDLARVRELAPQLLTMVPGIRPGGAPAHDQARAATPGQAISSGADVLVLGRAVTEATDRRRAAAAVAAEVWAASMQSGAGSSHPRWQRAR
jgi:orotidine-5'-phosphate decarboxylase